MYRNKYTAKRRSNNRIFIDLWVFIISDVLYVWKNAKQSNRTKMVRFKL